MDILDTLKESNVDGSNNSLDKLDVGEEDISCDGVSVDADDSNDSLDGTVDAVELDTPEQQDEHSVTKVPVDTKKKYGRFSASFTTFKPAKRSMSCTANIQLQTHGSNSSLKSSNRRKGSRKSTGYHEHTPKDDYHVQITPVTLKRPVNDFAGCDLYTTKSDLPSAASPSGSSSLQSKAEFVAPPPPVSPPPPLFDTPPPSQSSTPLRIAQSTEEISTTDLHCIRKLDLNDNTMDGSTTPNQSFELKASHSTEAMLKDLQKLNPTYQSDHAVNQGLSVEATSPGAKSPGGKRCSTNYPMAAPMSPGSPTELVRYSHSDRSSIDSGTSSGHHAAKPQTGHFVVVAIDFGTTFSGYAFSFTQEPNSIHMMRKWEGGDPGLINQKTPTCLLLEPDGTFHSFGFSARDFYHDLDASESKKWLFFDKFKMVLHYNAELNHDTMVAASNGVKFPAKKIFSYALAFFRDHALKELSDQSGLKIMSDDVKWVLTVPAIWKQPAKQFMREAAYEGGLASADNPDQLVISLEPEAASVYCRRLRMSQLVPDIPPPMAPLTLERNRKLHEPELVEDFVEDHLTQGSSYMVVDCGGGTVDITVHELAGTGGRLRELYRASGGPHGSVGVDNEFEQLLCCIFGADFIETFKIRRPAGWVDLMIAFESRKRSASPYKELPLNISLPFSFIDFYKRTKGRSVESAIRKYNDPDIRWSTQGMMRLTQEAMRKLFVPTIHKIKEAVGAVLVANSKGISYLFLVGGFAESPLLQAEIRKEFTPLLKIIIPQDVGLSILKGAVLFGQDPTIIHVRISRMTYGVGVLNRYVKGKHPTKKLIRRDGIEWCTDVFDKFVLTDQPVTLGDNVARSYTPAKSGQKTSVINIYSSERTDIQFITDHGVKKCGTLQLDLGTLPKTFTHKRREIQAKMEFGDTEIKVSAIDVATGASVKANIDFLSK